MVATLPGYSIPALMCCDDASLTRLLNVTNPETDFTSTYTNAQGTTNTPYVAWVNFAGFKETYRSLGSLNALVLNRGYNNREQVTSLALHNWNHSDNIPNYLHFQNTYNYGGSTDNGNLVSGSSQNSPSLVAAPSQSLLAGGSRPSAVGFDAGDGATERFTGKERDAESGLDYFGARYYGSALGRFSSPDPKQAGSDPSDPQSWNGYAYVTNNPMTNIDPDGLAGEKPCNPPDCWSTTVGAVADTIAVETFGLLYRSVAPTVHIEQKAFDWASQPRNGNCLAAIRAFRQERRSTISSRGPT